MNLLIVSVYHIDGLVDNSSLCLFKKSMVALYFFLAVIFMHNGIGGSKITGKASSWHNS